MTAEHKDHRPVVAYTAAIRHFKQGTKDNCYMPGSDDYDSYEAMWKIKTNESAGE